MFTRSLPSWEGVPLIPSSLDSWLCSQGLSGSHALWDRVLSYVVPENHLKELEVLITGH